MVFKTNSESQVERIKFKLMKAKEMDPNYDVFGSARFKYELNDVISIEELEKFEKELGAPLPEHFRIFVTQLGNGGIGSYYGISSLEYILEMDVGNCTKNPCCAYPNMNTEDWNEMIKHVHYTDRESVCKIYNKVINNRQRYIRW